MTKLILFAFILALPISGPAVAEGLSAEKELQLLELLRGWNSDNPSVTLADFFDSEPVKCGTPQMLAIRYYVDHGSPELKAAYRLYAEPRPDDAAPFWHNSPAGHFKVHYARTGPHAPYGSDGGIEVPEYVKSVAMILDSVWEFTIDSLGFHPPPSDSFYDDAEGKYDVYLVDMVTLGKGALYGYTVPEQRAGNWNIFASYMAMDNDFQEIPAYRNRPLDAARVTAAHEFFHAVQFGYDAMEFEVPVPGDQNSYRTHWMEMSAVWMEEQAYDHVNDYYGYLPRFYDFVHLSLRTAHLTMHPGLFYQYAAVVWPLYLSQTLGRDVVRNIWEKCAEIGGPNVFQNAFEDVIVEMSGGEHDFRSALAEFYIWNFFTGSRAVDGFGFIEAQYYDSIPDSQLTGLNTWQPYIRSHRSFPVDVELTAADYNFLPDYLGANYLRFNPARLDSTFRFVFDGEEQRIRNRDTTDFDWAVRVVNLDIGFNVTRLDVDPTIYSNHDTVFVRDPWRYSDILLVLMPFAKTKYSYIDRSVAYGYTVVDTTIPFTQVTFHDPYPNPLVLSETDKLTFKVEQPEESKKGIRLDVFTLAGEKVREDLSSSPDFIVWDGTNQSGEPVASGMYLVSIRLGNESKVFKVALIK